MQITGLKTISAWGRPIDGPGQAHILALAKPNMGPALAWDRARRGPGALPDSPALPSSSDACRAVAGVAIPIGTPKGIELRDLN